MKKFIILKHGGGELANQLWNYISIYAYGLETKTKVDNPSFFEYHSYFNFIENESTATKIFSYWFRDYFGRRGSTRNKFWRIIYKLYASVSALFHKDSIVSSENTESEVTYLPPTKEIKLEVNKNIYYLGWLFRNPLGLKKYRNELLSAFSPNESVTTRVNEIIKKIRSKGNKIIGIHIRQSDYKDFKDGVFVVDQKRFCEILKEYLTKMGLLSSKTSILITSDGPVDSGIFHGFDVYISKENAVTDLFLLSKTDALIGSNSSFGAFAGWYGNIPHIIATREPIDWPYYTDKKSFFENKYATLAKY